MRKAGMAGVSAPPVPPRRRRLVWRLIVGAAAGVLLLLLLVIVGVHSPPGRRRVLAYVERLLADQQIALNVDDLRYNLLSLSFSARNLSVRSLRAADLPSIARADRISIDVGLMALLRGQYVVESAAIEGLALNYVIDESGADNVPTTGEEGTTQEETSGDLRDYRVADLIVSNARVHVADHVRGIEADLPIASITIAGLALTNRHEVQLDAGAGHVRVDAREIPIDSVAIRLDLGTNDVAVQQAVVRLADSQATLTGTVNDFTAPTLDVGVKALLNVPSLAALASVEDRVAGVVDLDAHVRGAAERLKVEAQIAGRDLAFRSLDQLQLRAGGSYDQAARLAGVTDLHLQAPWGAAAANATVALDEAGASRVEARTEAIDVAALMAALDLPSRAATRLNAQLDASWTGMDYRRASGALRADLEATATRVRADTLPVSGRIEASARAGDVVVDLHRLRAAATDATGRLSLSASDHLTGRLRVRASDIGNVLASADAFLDRPRGSTVPVAVTGPVAVDTSLSGTLTSPLAVVNVEGRQMTIGSATAVDATASATYSPAAVAIHTADIGWADAWAHASGRIELAGSQRLDLKASGGSLRIPALLELAERSDLPIDGVSSFESTVAGSVARPVATIDLRVEDTMAYGETLGSITAAAAFANREAQLTTLALEKPQGDSPGRLQASGRYHIDRQSYDFVVKSDQLRLDRLILPDGTQVTAALDLDGRGQGTIADPAGTIELAIRDLQVGADAFGDITARTVLADRQAAITAAVPRFATVANARVGVTTPYPATLEARIDSLDFEALPLRLETPLSGRASATIQASGDAATPEGAQADVTLEEVSGEWNGQPFGLDGPAVLRYTDRRIHIDGFSAKAEDSTFSLSGTLPLSAEAGEGVIDIASRLSLATLVRYVPAEQGLSGDGTISIAGHVRGTLEAIDPQLTIDVENGLLLSPAIDPGIVGLSARARIGDGEAALERLSAAWGSAQIEASARMPLALVPELPVAIPRAAGEAALEARLTGLDPATIPGAPSGFGGRVGVEVKATGRDVTDVSAIAGDLTFSELEVTFRELSLAQSAPTVLSLRDGIASIASFNLSGTVGTVTASGTAGIADSGQLDLVAQGNLNLAGLSAFTEAVRAQGPVRFDLAARGTTDSPDLVGSLALEDVQVAVDEPRIGAEGIDARVSLSGARVTLDSLTGQLNGGSLQGSGVLAYSDGDISELDVQIATTDFAFDAPLDLRSVLDSTLRISRRPDEIAVEGRVAIKDAGLTADMNFDTGILAAIGARPQLELTERRNPLLEQVRLNIEVDTETPILLDNNLARAEVTTDLRVLGTPYETGLSGTLTVLEGGEITLNERRYEVERAVITFLDERRIEPSFDLRLNTSASRYDITVAVSGTPEDTESSFTSDPTLPEPDIMALLITGRTLDEMRGEEGEVVREQVLSHLTGRVGSTLGRGLERATGLSEVRIEPNLIANEADPGARLTVGQEITDELELVYSTNLADSNDQIWVAQYDLTRRFQTRTVRQSDNSYRLDFRHDVRFGGQPEPSRGRRERPAIDVVQVPADVEPGEAALRQLLRVDAGDSYDFFKVRRGVERVERYYRDRDHLEARVRLSRVQKDKAVDLTLAVTPGPLVALQFEGAMPPDDVREEVEEQWRRGVFDAQRIDDAEERLRKWLRDEHHLRPTIETHATPTVEDRRVVTFRIDPGARSERILLAFEGVTAVDPDDLAGIIADQDLEDKLYDDPLLVTELLQLYYREQGFLAARIEPPRYEFDGPVARVILAVEEGARFRTMRILVDGNRVIDTATLLREMPLLVTETYLPAAAERSLERIRDLYWRRGYNEVRSDYRLVADRERGEVEVTFTIQEGRQSRVAEVVVEGNERTREQLVREEVRLLPSEPLDLSALARSRRNLYKTGAFSVVDVTREEAPAGEAPDQTPGASTPEENDQKDIRIRVAVREVQPFQIGYGASYDTERGVGGILDVSNHNSLGRARVVGIRSRYDAQLREVRAYMSQPSLAVWPVKTTASIYYHEDRNPETTIADPFNFDRKGVSIQQEKELGNSYVWSYGFRYERIRTFTPQPGGRDETLSVAPLTSTFTRETRDEVLDASTGSFTSHGFSFSPSWLGSDTTYIKYFGQYFHYIPLQPVQSEPLTGELIRPRLVFATGVRLGLSKGFGGSVPTAERFFAGGSSTLRGFEQNAVGPIGADRIPEGGEALFVLNNELRVPLISIVDGVVFVDVGNAFARVQDFSFTDLRESAGVGIRLRTPWFLIRGDLGFALDPRAGERRSRFYFSIGQAF